MNRCMKTNRCLSVFFLFFVAFHLTAQSKDQYDQFINEAGSNSIINTGLVPIRYQTISEGTCFIESDVFRAGAIKYNGRVYYDLLLNLNSHLDELYVRSADSGEIIVLIKSYIDQFWIENFHFKKIDNSQMSGFYKVLYEGDHSLYKKTYKELYEKIKNDQQYVVRGFKEKISYFLVKDGDIIKITKPKRILKLFKEYKKELKRELNESGFNPKLYPDQYLITAVNWININVD